MKIKSTQWVELPVNKLVKAPWNYKKEDVTLTQKLAANVRLNGQVENLRVRDMEDGNYEVVNGNHRLEVFNILKWKTCICFNFGKITDAKAQRIAIETNETKFESDTAQLAELIKDMALVPNAEFDIDDLLATMPYDEKTLRGFGELVDFDWDKFQRPEEEPQVLDPELKPLVCPSCGFEMPKA